MFAERAAGPRRSLRLLALILMVSSGCSDSDRVAQVALEGARRQADLDQELTRLNREVAQGTRALLESRREADQQLSAQAQGLQQQRDLLDAERQSIAAARQRDSLLAPALMNFGALVICSLPLVLCWFLLHRAGEASTDPRMTQLLVEQFMTPVASGPGLFLPIDPLPPPLDLPPRSLITTDSDVRDRPAAIG